MGLEDERVFDSLMSCSDALQALKEEHDPILAREAERVINNLIQELQKRRVPDPECKYLLRDNRGFWCHYDNSSVGFCVEELCPLEREKK